jgi:hypothetical protein
VIDQSTSIDLRAFKSLLSTGFVEAVDASADDGDCYLNPAITLAGVEYLHTYLPAKACPWWKSFDRRIAVMSIVATVIGIIVAMPI